MTHAHDPASGSLVRSSGIGEVPIAATRSDLLSQLLMLIRLRGEMIYTASLTAPWALELPPGTAHFHFIEIGSAVVSAEDIAPTMISEGELLLLSRGHGHILRGVGNPLLEPAAAFAPGIFDPEHLAIDHGGGGDLTRIVSGTFHFDDNSSPVLIGALPPMIRVSRNDGANAVWLEALVHFLLAEAHLPAPGSSIMISRLIDVMVVQTLRSWAAGKGRESRSWLGAIGDPGVERALSALHAEPMRDWTVSDLASIAAMSRSVFAERFAERVGDPPLRYLKHWRLDLAADMLKAGRMKVGEVARRAGYDSDAAFSRAYKARFGEPPASTVANAGRR